MARLSKPNAQPMHQLERTGVPSEASDETRHQTW
jgi:hypothetical protein